MDNPFIHQWGELPSYSKNPDKLYIIIVSWNKVTYAHKVFFTNAGAVYGYISTHGTTYAKSFKVSHTREEFIDQLTRTTNMGITRVMVSAVNSIGDNVEIYYHVVPIRGTFPKTE